MRLTRHLLPGLCLALAAVAAPAADVDWPTHGLDAQSTRHSPLADIDQGNVSRLTEAWTFRSGVKGTFQATPVVVDGRMFVGLPSSHVVALDARTGQELWRYRHQTRPGFKPCCGPANRGVAVAEGKVFLGALDARLIALDAATGQVLWDTDVARQADSDVDTTAMATSMSDVVRAGDALARQSVTGGQGIGIGMAPLVAGKRVIVGTNGAGYGVHTEGAVIGAEDQRAPSAVMAAFDIDTGKPLWRFRVTGPGWEGPMRATTADHLPVYREIAQERRALPKHKEAWRHGGGSLYSTPAWDPARDWIFFGTGNPAPNMEGDTRPGDNLHTSSLVALDARTGRLVWYHQQVPHDLWGYDVASTPVLFDLKQGGRTRPAVAQPSKLGWVYVYDRASGRLLFRSDRFVPQSNFMARANESGVVLAPGIAGGANWSPSAYDAASGQLVVPGIDMPTRYRRGTSPSGIAFVATEFAEKRRGTLTALDLQHGGRLRWQRQLDEPAIGGLLSTAGGLLFTGIGDRTFAALDARTGDTLWQSKRSAGVNAPPITYRVGAQQFIAVAVGGNSLFGMPTGDELAVFRLPD
ncbi:pyrroloquinoline quinone-dependent dehydrogenase [Hydrogenophaga sp. RWCD_12]|uniref:pyrroloquinoline quinone-dependent dehydrogenase n=1 Tax=Hydrogenophaga sp. RWCD_12 TaxID=3391190 RepID=UPI0039851B72